MHPERIEPQPGQESVWDYPRPPRIEPTSEHVIVSFRGMTLAESTRAIRVLETSQPPAYYIPPGDVSFDMLVEGDGHSFCEWKGEASYFDLVVPGTRIEQVAWTYAHPSVPFAAIKDYLGFYAQKLECTVDREAVMPNEGSFYGGWVTSKVVGPFKGVPGSKWW
jgi:uncharacterized protein (DUF427 family)